jgi:hypothetical protein
LAKNKITFMENFIGRAAEIKVEKMRKKKPFLLLC